MTQELKELSWPQIRQQVLERDRYTCQGRECRGEYKVLDVHHKIPLSKGGTDDLENLITLCSPCHNKEEPKYPYKRLPKPKQWNGKLISCLKTTRVRSVSIRTTLPKRIIENLELQHKDVIEWESYQEKGRKFARIWKLE